MPDLPRYEAGCMSERDQADYEAALDHFVEGRWSDAQKLLEMLRNDGPSQYLLRHIAEQGGRAPKDWNGTIVAAAK
jgi:hypothetical protein